MPSTKSPLLSRRHKQEAISLNRLCSEWVCEISTYLGCGTVESQKQLLTSLLSSALWRRQNGLSGRGVSGRITLHQSAIWTWTRVTRRDDSTRCQLVFFRETGKEERKEQEVRDVRELEGASKSICHRLSMCMHLLILPQCMPASNKQTILRFLQSVCVQTLLLCFPIQSYRNC